MPRARDAGWHDETVDEVFANTGYVTATTDHEQLFKRLSKIKGDFLMSYDNTSEVLELAKQYGFETRAISMKNTHHATRS